jgi:hypothetical protein
MYPYCPKQFPLLERCYLTNIPGREADKELHTHGWNDPNTSFPQSNIHQAVEKENHPKTQEEPQESYY